MKKIVLFLTAICLFQTQLISQSSSKKKLKVEVVLTDSFNSNIEEAEISFIKENNRSKYAANQGLAYLPEAGTYQLKAFAPGFIPILLKFNLAHDTIIQLQMKQNVVIHESVIIKVTRAKENTSFVQTTISSAKLAPVNLGQDFTYLIGNTPSAVSTSDAGAGVGYTGIRIRGSDATRINVTVNGIPINDAESHGVYWVNMPDLASSTSSVQIQRGVGSSTIGTGAFGANININNLIQSSSPFAQLQQSYGSFNTLKSTIMFGTGDINGLNFSGRLSKIKSDGYVDRGASDLQSYQFNLNYTKGKWFINALGFGGKEKTYQSWYGTPQSRIDGNVDSMNAYADRNGLSNAQRNNLLNSGRTYNYYTYNNQTDNYGQYHYQLHFNRTINSRLKLSSSFFTTVGKGFYEEFKEDASFKNYGVSDYIVGTDTFSSTDLVRQRWLDNIIYGNFTSFEYKAKKLQLNGGINISQYDGKHFGKVIWAEIASPFGKDFEYYHSNSKKTELNSFVKSSYNFNKLTIDAELQFRNIHYTANGNDNDLTKIDFDVKYQFFNPKLGLVYNLNKKSKAYGSVSVGNREPVRTDFIDNPVATVPKAEHLTDFEFGYMYHNNKDHYQFNLYAMEYKNQLVVTGELNDVGNSLRRNVDKSYRRGVELMLEKMIIRKLALNFNLNLSDNKIQNFNDRFFDYDQYNYKTETYKKTPIAFSPSAVGFVGLTDHHIRKTELGLNLKYVGKQYLDNTGNEGRKLDPYTTLNFNILKHFNFKNGSELVFKGMVNNILGTFYSNNGYTYKYAYSGKLIVENFYYPQTGRNFMIGLDFKFQ